MKTPSAKASFSEKPHETPTPTPLDLVEPEKAALRTFRNTSRLVNMEAGVNIKPYLLYSRATAPLRLAARKERERLASLESKSRIKKRNDETRARLYS